MFPMVIHCEAAHCHCLSQAAHTNWYLALALTSAGPSYQCCLLSSDTNSPVQALLHTIITVLSG